MTGSGANGDHEQHGSEPKEISPRAALLTPGWFHCGGTFSACIVPRVNTLVNLLRMIQIMSQSIGFFSHFLVDMEDACWPNLLGFASLFWFGRKLLRRFWEKLEASNST